MKKRRQGSKDVLEGKYTFRFGRKPASSVQIKLMPSREYFRQMMDSVNKPFPECVDYLVQNIDLDPHFHEYFQWALKNGIPTVIVSGGMKPIVEAILKNLVGPDSEKMDVICNDVEARPGMSIDQQAGWQIKYHDERSVELSGLIPTLFINTDQRLRPRQVPDHPSVCSTAAGSTANAVLCWRWRVRSISRTRDGSPIRKERQRSHPILCEGECAVHSL